MIFMKLAPFSMGNSRSVKYSEWAHTDAYAEVGSEISLSKAAAGLPLTDHSASGLARTLQKQGKQASLIHVLEEVQTQFRYLPQEAMVLVSERLGVPLSQVYSVATFYHSFSLQPRGLHMLLVCTGTACHVRGAQQILDRLQTQLNIEPGGTTQDGLLTMETGKCLGACALGPAAVLDNQYEGQMSIKKVDRLLKGLMRNSEKERG